MKNLMFKFGVLFVLGINFINLNAQQNTVSTGQSVKDNGGSISSSIGQITYSFKTNSNGSVSEGVQNAYEISIVTEIDLVKNNNNLSVSAYPNPTTDFIQIEVNTEELNDFSFQLFDTNGRLLQKSKLTQKRSNILMSGLTPSTYFVNVLLGNSIIRTFKIIKK